MISLPLNVLTGDATTLFGWTGRFWQQVCQDGEFVKRLLAARGMSASQLAITGQETLALSDRHNIPVLHRERWYPIQILESQRNRGGAAALKLGSKPMTVLGPQPPGVFPTGLIFKLGGYTDFTNISAYPLGQAVKGVATMIVDSLDEPNIILTPKDFAVQDNSLVVRRSHDPFSLNLPGVTHVPGSSDRTITLWAIDALFDYQYLSRHLSYALGLPDVPSSEYWKRLVNSAWNALTGSGTEALTVELAAAIYDIPVAQMDEPVTSIVTDTGADGTSCAVITPANLYNVPYVSSAIKAGELVYRGQPLTDALQFFSNVFDPASAGAAFRTAVPAVTFPPAFFAADLKFGLTADWNPVPIVVDGFDTYGNPRLRFSFGGDPADDQTFWEYVWAQCERDGLPTRTCFIGWIDDIVIPTDGAVLGYVAPLEYVLRNFAGANCLFLTVDTTKLSVDGQRASSLGYVGLLQDTVPAYACLFVIERREIPKESYPLTTSTDTATVYAGCEVKSQATVGVPAGGRAGYKDVGVSYQWVATCK